MAGSVEITIINYDKYKGRADVTLNSWFRLSNRFLEDPDFFGFNSDEKLTWIYVLSLASQKNTGSFSINFAHADRVCGLSPKLVKTALEKLNNIKCLSIDVTQTLRERNADVLLTPIARALHNITEHNNTEQDITEHNITISPEPQKAVAVVNSSLFIISSTQQIPIKTDLVKSWADTYPKEFLQASFKEMRNWVLSNQQKAPKSNWTRFMNNWFARGWERHRTTIKSNPTQLTAEDLNDILRGE